MPNIKFFGNAKTVHALEREYQLELSKLNQAYAKTYAKLINDLATSMLNEKNFSAAKKVIEDFKQITEEQLENVNDLFVHLESEEIYLHQSELHAVQFTAIKKSLRVEICNLADQINVIRLFTWNGIIELYQRLDEIQKEYTDLSAQISVKKTHTLTKEQLLKIIREFTLLSFKYDLRVRSINKKFAIFKNEAAFVHLVKFKYAALSLYESIQHTHIDLAIQIDQARYQIEEFHITHNSELTNLFKVRRNWREASKNENPSLKFLATYFGSLNIAIIDVQESYNKILTNEDEPIIILTNFHQSISEADWYGVLEIINKLITYTENCTLDVNEQEVQIMLLANLREQAAVIQALQDYGDEVKEAMELVSGNSAESAKGQERLQDIVEEFKNCCKAENPDSDVVVAEEDFAKKIVKLLEKVTQQSSKNNDSSSITLNI